LFLIALFSARSLSAFPDLLPHPFLSPTLMAKLTETAFREVKFLWTPRVWFRYSEASQITNFCGDVLPDECRCSRGGTAVPGSGLPPRLKTLAFALQGLKMSEPGIRCSVFLLAQNRLLREALARILDRKPDIHVVGSCAISPLALEEITNASPEIVLMDSLPSSESRADFIQETQQCVPGVKIMMISMDADKQLLLQAVREGAVGCVLKHASSLEVGSAVRAVARGEAVCPSELCIALFEYWRDRRCRSPASR